MTAVPEAQKCPVCDRETEDPDDCAHCWWPIASDASVSVTAWARRVLKERDEARARIESYEALRQFRESLR